MDQGPRLPGCERDGEQSARRYGPARCHPLPGRFYRASKQALLLLTQARFAGPSRGGLRAMRVLNEAAWWT